MLRETDGMVGTEWQPVDLLWRISATRPAGAKAREILKWLHEYEGVGKYYVDEIFGQHYFERDEDREMFLLRWS
jgi:hypothetical protein